MRKSPDTEPDAKKSSKVEILFFQFAKENMAAAPALLHYLSGAFLLRIEMMAF